MWLNHKKLIYLFVFFFFTTFAINEMFYIIQHAVIICGAATNYYFHC